MRLPLDRFLNAVLWWSLERIEPDDRDLWLVRLNEPLPGRETEATREDEARGFADFASMFGVAQPATG